MASRFPGTFGGHFSFVPGTIDSPTGNEFAVHVGEVNLTVPTFLY